MQGFEGLADAIAASVDPREITLRLVERALDIVPADRCTLTSVDEHVLRVEASFERDRGHPAWIGHEYSFDYVDTQPLLQEALGSGRIVLGGGFDQRSTAAELRDDLRGVRHTAVIPLSLGGTTVAVLILSRRDDPPFNLGELTQLQEIGAFSVLALRNARLIAAVRDGQERGLETLTRISSHLASTEELPVFFGKMSATVAQLVGAEKAAFWLRHGNELAAQQEAFGFEPDVLAQMRVDFTRSRGPLANVVGAGDALVTGISEEALRGPFGDVLRLMRARDLIVVPWRTAEENLGVLMACNASAHFGSQDAWVMRVAARAAALVWQGYEANRRLVEMQERESEAMAEHAREVAELEQQKSRFLRLASHELRTPLTIMRGYLSMFGEGAFGEMPAAAQSALSTMASRVEQIKILVDQMLDTARLEDSALMLSIRPLRLDEAVARVVQSLEGLRQPNQTLECDPPDAQVWVEGDPEKVDTIIGNLVTNAIKYSPRGGDIRCTIKVDERSAHLAVSDTGIGIGESDLPRLFQRFGRLERPETGSIEGTGLGLFLSRELARLQGGDITVASEVGRGSTFTLSLPLATPVG